MGINEPSNQCSLLVNAMPSDPTLLLFTGKGGVGKSTTSASTAVYHASQGLRTILVSTDPAHSTDDVVAIPIGLTLKKIDDNLWVQNLDTTTEAEAFIQRLNSYLSESFGKSLEGFDPEMISETAAFPGMDEYFALEKILGLIEGTEVCPDDGKPYDVVVFDTAPTGHTLRALATPEHLKRFILRVMRMRRFLANLKGAFLFKKKEDPIKQALDDIVDRSDRFMAHLRDSARVGVYLVSIPTDAGFQECARTVGWLQKGMKIPVAGLIVNQIVPDVGKEYWEESVNNPAVALLRSEFEMQRPYLKHFEDLCATEGVHLVGITRVPYEPRGLERLNAFSQYLWSPGGGLHPPATLITAS